MISTTIVRNVICDRCGKVVQQDNDNDSTGMVHYQCPAGSNLDHMMYMVDVKEGEHSRPLFNLSNKDFCPECLILSLADWLHLEVSIIGNSDKTKKR